MKNITGLLLGVLIFGLNDTSAAAQSGKSSLVPLPSVEDFTKGSDGWAFGLGIGVEYESAYEGSDEYDFEVDPAGAVQWRTGDDIFYWAGEAIGWRGLRSDIWLFDAALAFDEGREDSDSDKGHLDGLGTGEESTELVLQIRRTFDANWQYWLDGRLVTGNNGNLGLLGVGRRFGNKSDGSGHEIAIAVVFHDDDYANKDFGIDADQSVRSGLTNTNLSSGYRSVGFNYNYRHYLGENWQVFGEAVYERYGSEIEKSPIARSSYEAEVGFGFIYVF